MILYNSNLFQDDPLYKFHFEDFVLPENIILHLGDDPINRVRKNDSEKHILIDLEEPNRFSHPVSQITAFECENFYDKILTINPQFVKNRNRILNKEIYIHIFFPYSKRYIIENFDKENDIIYTGNVDYYNMLDEFRKHKYIWLGKYLNNATHRDVDYETKLNLTRQSKIALSHSILDFHEVIPFMDTIKDSISHFNGIIEQHKARTIEAAFNKAIIVHIKTGQNVIEEFFTENEDFVYYEKGLVDDILNNYESYQYLSENAYNKSINNYTTEHFFNKYIKPLI